MNASHVNLSKKNLLYSSIQNIVNKLYLCESPTNGKSQRLAIKAAKLTRVSWLPSFAETSARFSLRAYGECK